MLDFLHRHVVLPAVAIKRGSRHLRDLAWLERSQFESRAEIEARQLAMLQATLRHTYVTVPYYRQRWTAAGLHPDAVRSLNDLAAFPVLTKADIRAHNLELLSDAYKGQKLREKTTSGSTGVPLRIFLDERGAQFKTAMTLRSDEWSGWRRGQRVAKVWGNPEYRHEGWRGRLRNAIIDRAIYLDTIQLNDDRIREFVASLRDHRPGLLFGHAHSLYLVACRLKAMKIDDIRPNGIISTSMPLHDWQRSTIEQVFGTKATNRYGCEEVSLIACECERHEGLHLASESVFTEVEPDGKLLVTDLTNFAMPLIRYRVGDVVRLADKPCSCGRGLPMISKIEGREADYVLTPAGNLISGISLTENFAMHIPGVAQLQIIQESRTELRLKLVRGDGFTEASHRKITELVLSLFGPTMKHTVEFVDLIPQEPSGKYRFCISKVATEHLKSLSV
ncbi:MAG: phenylacetate--CoA ligase family protein [Fimbriiglobus sp.]